MELQGIIFLLSINFQMPTDKLICPFLIWDQYDFSTWCPTSIQQYLLLCYKTIKKGLCAGKVNDSILFLVRIQKQTKKIKKKNQQ